jgi:hypothetical protein
VLLLLLLLQRSRRLGLRLRRSRAPGLSLGLGLSQLELGLEPRGLRRQHRHARVDVWPVPDTSTYTSGTYTTGARRRSPVDSPTAGSSVTAGAGASGGAGAGAVVVAVLGVLIQPDGLELRQARRDAVPTLDLDQFSP